MLGRVGKVLLAAGFVAYPILLHSFILEDEVELWRLLLVFAPLLGVASWVMFRSLPRSWWPLLLLAMAALLYYIVTGNHGRVGLLAVNGFSHATLNLFLLWLFGRTLLRGREPLIAQIASHINGPLTPEIAVYTRQVTIVWCAYFLLQVLVSLLLYIFTPITAWSFFINVLNLPLLALMFIGEHSYRRMRFPDQHRTSILKAIEVYSRDFAVPKKTDKQP